MQKIYFFYFVLALLLPCSVFSQTVHSVTDTCFNANFSIAYYLTTTVESDAGINTVTFSFTEGTASLSEISGLQIYRDVDARYQNRERIAIVPTLPANGTFVFVDEHADWVNDGGGDYGYTGSGTLPALTPLFYSVVVNKASGTARPRRSIPAIHLPDPPTDVITDNINSDMTLITEVYPNADDMTVVLKMDFGPNYDYFQQVLLNATPGEPIYPAGDRPVFFGRIFLNNVPTPGGRTNINYGDLYWGHEGSAYAKFSVDPAFLDANNTAYAWFNSGRPGHASVVPVPIRFETPQDPGPDFPSTDNATVHTSNDICYNDNLSIAYELTTTVISEAGKNTVVLEFTEGTNTLDEVSGIQIYRDVDARHQNRERIAIASISLPLNGRFIFVDEHANWVNDGGGDYGYTGTGTLPDLTPLFYSFVITKASGTARPRRSTPAIYLPDPPTDVITDDINNDMTLITEVYPNSDDNTVILKMDFGPNYDYYQQVLLDATPGQPIYPAGDRPIFFGRIFLNNVSTPSGRTNINYGNLYWGHEGSAYAKFSVDPAFLDANNTAYAWFNSGRPGHASVVPVPIMFDMPIDPGPDFPSTDNATVHSSTDICYNDNLSIAYELTTTVISEAGKNTVVLEFTEGTNTLDEVSGIQIYRDVDARHQNRGRIAIASISLPLNGRFIFIDEHEVWTQDGGGEYGYTGTGTLPAETPFFYSFVVDKASGTARPRRSTPGIYLPNLPTDVITDDINSDMTLITQVYPNPVDTTVILQLDFGPNYDYFQQVLLDATPGQPIYPAGDRPVFFGRVFLNNVSTPNGRTNINYGNLYWGHEGSAFAKFKVDLDFLDANGTAYAWFNSGRPGHASVVAVPINFGYDLSALPIELHSFEALQDGKDVHLTWETNTEQNTQNYTLERSTDNGRTFHSISTVTAENNIAGATYEYTDEGATNLGTQYLYYRLHALDWDGSNQTLGPVAVELQTRVTDALRVFPNPVTSGQSIKIKGAAAGAKVELFSIDGRLVVTLPAVDDTEGNFSLPDLPPGVYTLQTTDPVGERKTTRVVIR
ncbi:MAG: T9SS type A sorting domain-containing protein [Lewinella sp.]